MKGRIIKKKNKLFSNLRQNQQCSLSARKLVVFFKSSIAILILRINSIASLPIQMSARKLAAFFTLILDFKFVHFDPNLINKILISSI